MIRFGFDPILEAEQEHQKLIKEVALYRMIRETSKNKKTSESMHYRILAFIGKSMTSLGTSLTTRYGSDINPQATMQASEEAGEC